MTCDEVTEFLLDYLSRRSSPGGADNVRRRTSPSAATVATTSIATARRSRSPSSPRQSNRIGFPEELVAAVVRARTQPDHDHHPCQS